MSRHARIVIPGLPHHVIQRGTRRQIVFFCDEDRVAYINILSKYARASGIEFWAYCLMENHVHFIVVPGNKKSLAEGFGRAHKIYTEFINEREGWRGYLWQGRFLSHPLDDQYLLAAVRYVEMNPVRAGIVQKAEYYPWSSARFHVSGTRDRLVSSNSLSDVITDWAGYLGQEEKNPVVSVFRECAKSGLPLGSDDFISKLEKVTGMSLKKMKPGPKNRDGSNHQDISQISFEDDS